MAETTTSDPARGCSLIRQRHTTNHDLYLGADGKKDGGSCGFILGEMSRALGAVAQGRGPWQLSMCASFSAPWSASS